MSCFFAFSMTILSGSLLSSFKFNVFFFCQDPPVDSENFKSRGYQDDLLKICVERNTIIYLPTGAGKTFITIMAIKHFANSLLK